MIVYCPPNCECKSPIYLAVIDRFIPKEFKGFHMPHILSFQRNKTSLDCCVVNNINEMCVSLTSAGGNDTDLVARLPNMYEKD